MKTNSKSKRGSIKTKLIVIPLIVVFIVIASIGIFSSYFLRTSLRDEMENNGVYMAERFIANIEDNYRSLEIINDFLDNKIKSAGKMVMGNENMLSNEFIKRLAEDLEVEQIIYYNSDGVAVYSNIDEYIGWKADKGHAVHNFMISSDKELMEEIRKDSESDNYLKYGYIKGSEGTFVQVGINANKVQELTDSFSYQSFLDEISQDEQIYYGLFVDKNLQVLAHNNKEEIGIILDDEGSKAAAIDGVLFTQEWYYEESDVNVLDISYPVVINGEHIGAVSIGLSMDKVQKTIKNNIIFVVAIMIVSFIVLGFILFSVSNYAVKIITRLKEQMQYMEKGDFSNDISEDLINKNDELGEISQAISIMQTSVRDIIKNVIDTSHSLATSSEELTAISQQSATAADEIARAIEEIATGATEQAKDTEIGVLSISELGDIVMKNESHIGNLNDSAERVNRLKDEGLDVLKVLVEKTDINSKYSEEVQQVIIDTNESAEKIANASEMIKSIASQTNLLALNAAIEAARAGDAGRGFAVVAEEIRKLAEQSNKFTEEIGTIVEDLNNKTLTAVKTMEELEDIVLSQTKSVDITNSKFAGIAEAIEDMKMAINEVNHSSDEITIKKQDIIKIMENLSAISEENAAGTEEASASVEEQTAAMEEIANSSEQLSVIAEKLNDQVKQFKI